MKTYRRLAEPARKKARNRELLVAQPALPLEQFLSDVRNNIEGYDANGQLTSVTSPLLITPPQTNPSCL